MTTEAFSGFSVPKSNYSKLPHDIINALPQIETLAEMKVILYILRHTWGYQEYGPEENKKITLDEFQHGRKRKDQTRMDNGVGMTKTSVVDGLKRAQEHGFIIVLVDDHDAARIKKYYSLNMADDSQVSKNYTPGVQKLDHRCPETGKRTEKDTLERNSGKLRLSEKTAKPAEKEFLGVDDDFRIAYYYKDKEHVSAVNSYVRPPWIITCSCGNDVQVDSLDEPYECLCGMHEYVLTKTKPKVSVQREHEAVEAYLLISGRKKHTIAQEWLDEIANTVTDLPFWRTVVKEYCGRGWNRGNIAKMLEYYTDRKIPGERTQKEPEQPAEPMARGRGPDIEYVPGKGWVKHDS